MTTRTRTRGTVAVTLVVGVLLAAVTVAVRDWFQAGDVAAPLDKNKPNHVVLTVAWRPTRTMLINWQVGPTSGKNIRLRTSPWTRVQYAARGELVRLNVHTVELVPDPDRSLTCLIEVNGHRVAGGDEYRNICGLEYVVWDL